MTTENTYTTITLDPFSDPFIENPYADQGKLRDAGDVVWVESLGCWGTGKASIVKQVLADHDTFVSSGGVGLDNFLTDGTSWRTLSLLLEADQPDHTVARNIIMSVMSPKALRELRERMETEAAKHAHTLVAQDQVEAVTELAEPFPLKVFADSVGIREDGRRFLIDWGNMIFNTLGPKNKYYDKAMANAAEVAQWVAEACQRENMSPDGLGAQVHAMAAEQGFDAAYGARLVRIFLSAGIDTTVHMITNALWLFATYPDQWTILRNNPKLVKPALEEVLRFESPFQGYFRTALQDTEVAGVPIKKHQKFYVNIASANRDPEAWDNPDQFDVTRKPVGHVAFGHGIHTCVGQMMARLEGEVLFNALLPIVERIEFADEPVRQMHNNLRGFERLPIRFVRDTQAKG
jgi:cytochrome P450